VNGEPIGELMNGDSIRKHTADPGFTCAWTVSYPLRRCGALGEFELVRLHDDARVLCRQHAHLAGKLYGWRSLLVETRPFKETSTFTDEK
jgi:hypothetical protein